jgi:hypothetical protein
METNNKGVKANVKKNWIGALVWLVVFLATFALWTQGMLLAAGGKISDLSQPADTTAEVTLGNNSSTDDCPSVMIFIGDVYGLLVDKQVVKTDACKP